MQGIGALNVHPSLAGSCNNNFRPTTSGLLIHGRGKDSKGDSMVATVDWLEIRLDIMVLGFTIGNIHGLEK